MKRVEHWGSAGTFKAGRGEGNWSILYACGAWSGEQGE